MLMLYVTHIFKVLIPETHYILGYWELVLEHLKFGEAQFYL